TPLRQLLIDAVRYGDRPETRAKLFEQVDAALDRGRLRALLQERSLVEGALDTRKVLEIRDEMERAEARRLQPHFVEAFFRRAFALLGGTMREREPRRYEISHVPAAIKLRDRQIGRGAPVLDRYERVTFEKELRNAPGKPPAAFLCPGHPLLDATIDLILERHRELFKRGAALVDPDPARTGLRVLVCLEHDVQDGKINPDGSRRVVSKRLQFVEIDEAGAVRDAGPAPYLDYRPLTDAERAAIESDLAAPWLAEASFERIAADYAAQRLGREHLAAIRERKERLVARTMAAVKDRLTKEINHWDHRAVQLRLQEAAGKRGTSRLNAELAKRRANDLEARLQSRMAELEQERHVSARPPVVVGGALIVPAALVDGATGRALDGPDPEITQRIDRLAVDAVLAAERALGHEPREMPHNHPGYDVESRALDGHLRFIEVKGKSAGQTT
ncbi:MAG TPA: DUF3883 domain-containing protein, partial [Thermomicrobiales bacterium]|nr:DUF3883 domain-containing protein [Thermomicrobiales bacterium]